MKVLYAIQGTGNGHLSRAREILPALMKRVNVDVLISGTQVDIPFPFHVKYRYKGVSFIFGKNGGVDLFKTVKHHNIFNIIKEIKNCPVKDYDLVINDFEPISAWACKLKGVWCISLSHQASLLSKNVPQPDHNDWLGSFILKSYAPFDEAFSFHFTKYDKNIYLPIIKREIREIEAFKMGHYTVYLPSYNDERIIKVLSEIEDTKWQVFSKHCKSEYTEKNIQLFPIANNAFIESMANADGVLCGAGFETPAEALYLRKKLLVIPMKNQYEQQFNAKSLSEIGIPVIKNLKKKNIKKIKKWVEDANPIEVNFPDQTQYIVDRLLQEFIADRMLREYIVSYDKGFEG